MCSIQQVPSKLWLSGHTNVQVNVSHVYLTEDSLLGQEGRDLWPKSCTAILPLSLMDPWLSQEEEKGWTLGPVGVQVSETGFPFLTRGEDVAQVSLG